MTKQEAFDKARATAKPSYPMAVVIQGGEYCVRKYTISLLNHKDVVVVALVWSDGGIDYCQPNKC